MADPSRTDGDAAPAADSTVGTRAQSGTPPGPDGAPLVGNTLQFLRDPVGFHEVCRRYDSDVVAYSIGGTDGLMLTHPDDIERVLVSEAGEFRRAEVIRDAVGGVVAGGGGLFLTEGETWRRERTSLQPAFYRDRIETYAGMMGEYAAARAAEWSAGDVVDVTGEMQTLTLAVLAKTLLDVDIRGRESAIGDAADAVTDHFDTRSISAFLPLWVPTPANRRARHALARLEEVIGDLVATRRASDGDPGDLLSILLDTEFEDGSTLTDRSVRDHLVTFLVAGHETTALWLSYTLFLLATHPDRQARLVDELDATLDAGPPSVADLFELDYLRHVLDESLRLYPPAYTVFREPTRDVTVRGYDVSAGTTLSMPQWVVHRDERWYDDPGAFRPERWTDDFREALPDYAYYPFGGGPRHCIGMRFARMEAKVLLATLAGQFRFEPVTEPPLELSMQITLQPDEPLRVGLAER